MGLDDASGQRLAASCCHRPTEVGLTLQAPTPSFQSMFRLSRPLQHPRILRETAALAAVLWGIYALGGSIAHSAGPAVERRQHRCLRPPGSRPKPSTPSKPPFLDQHMPNLLLPFLLVALLPGLYLAWRLGWTKHRGGRLVIATTALAGTLLAMPWSGLDVVYIKRLNLLLAGALAALLGLRALRVRWALDQRLYHRVLLALAGLAVLGYLNFFDFHGQRTFVHLHDVAHYYLGAKYYAELGYGDLYTAMLRAEAEVYDDHFKAVEARDLATYRQVHIRTLLHRSEPIKEAFTAARWRDFQRDVAYFRDTLGPLYGRVLLDHGFNPTPVWALLGGAVSQAVPAGSGRGILLLSLLDPLLLVLMLIAVWRTFGADTALLATTYLAVLFASPPPPQLRCPAARPSLAMGRAQLGGLLLRLLGLAGADLSSFARAAGANLRG